MTEFEKESIKLRTFAKMHRILEVIESEVNQ